MAEKTPDVLIVGGGPAGLTAAIYARRAGLEVGIIEKMFFGGQMSTTPEIANYPGVPDTTGFELSQAMKKQADDLGVKTTAANITGLDLTPGSLAAITAEGRIEAKTLILAMGAQRRKLGIDGEDAFTGRGVSYCATCDGNFFRGMDVAVVGGGNTALEDAEYLSGLCGKVYLVHRRDEFRGGKILENRVRAASNIELVLSHVPVSISGGMKAEAFTVKHIVTGEEKTLPVSAVFVAVGTVPETALLRGLLPLDSQGRVESSEDCSTPVPGVFVAGDLRKKPLYQIVTATSDGAVAATAAFQFLQEQAI